jgi:glutathione synthase/RimK-type ligase-like ATP-grasp enzyme
MILIITYSARDITVYRLGKALREQGAEPVVIGPEAIEALSSLSIEGGADGGASCRFTVEGRVIDFADVRSAWLWRGWQRFPDEEPLRDLATKTNEWSFYRSEWLTYHKGFTLSLAHSGVFCVNPPPLNLAFEEKCCQLMLAARSGLRIPPTLYSARLAPVREFHEAHGGKVIYKPFTSFAHLLETEPEQPLRGVKLYTSRIKEEQLVEGPGFIPTPGIFQPYVEKKLELRIVVVGRRLFACAIHSQQSERSREDWRRYDLENTPYVPYDLPPDIAEKILNFMGRLGLVFGSIDMIVTPEDEYIFLEVNPNGQFDWVAKRTGLPLYEHLAAMLIAGRADYPAPAEREVSHAQ